MSEELNLRLWLAGQLSEDIEIIEPPTNARFKWRDFNDPVTPCEWDYIVRKVEEKLVTKELHDDYIIELSYQASLKNERLITPPPSWQTRAIALMKAKGRKE